MNKSLPWITCLLVSALAPAAALAQDEPPPPLAIGGIAPMADAKLKNVDGRSLTITDAGGKKGTLVIFTCNSCPYAKAWETRIAAIGNTALRRGIGVVAINANDPERNAEDSFDEMVARAKRLSIRYPYVMDETSNVARAFGATRTPEAYLFDAKGKLVYHGAIDDNARDASAVKQPYLKRAVDGVVSGKAIRVAETKAIGCGIKFRKA